MNTILIAMIRCKGKQNNQAVRKSCRQWYPLAANGLNAALTDKSYSRAVGYSRGFRPFKRLGSMSGK